MFSKNLKYYRLKKNMSKKELASLVKVTPMAISHYESGERRPGMDIIKALASALDVRVSDFLCNRNENLTFTHGEFRTDSIPLWIFWVEKSFRRRRHAMG